MLLMSSRGMAGTNPSPIDLNPTRFALLSRAMQADSGQTVKQIQRKSGIKAALFSVVLPGAGQAYNGSYWKTAVFAGLEIAFWTANVVYNKKGDDEDVRMRHFGDAHWNERKYWSKVYSKAVAEGVWSDSDPTVQIGTDNLILESYYTQDVINALRQKEAQVGYTHTLPDTKTQQYYEMIYKYLHQFGVGWDDAPDFNYYDDINNLRKLTPHISAYRSMRDRSNGYYDVATNMVILVMVNHLASMFEAAYSAKAHNKKYHLSIDTHRQRVGYEVVNMYGLNLSW